VKACFNHRLPAPIFFWRDQGGHEIDLLIEHGNVLYPVEIKSGATVVRDMFEGLKWWTRLAGQKSSLPTLVYGGAESYQREGIEVRPWFSV
jgi:predicted AAA+ superfamily ATPase